jgi:hypothetical protein
MARRPASRREGAGLLRAATTLINSRRILSASVYCGDVSRTIQELHDTMKHAEIRSQPAPRATWVDSRLELNAATEDRADVTVWPLQRSTRELSGSRWSVKLVAPPSFAGLLAVLATGAELISGGRTWSHSLLVRLRKTWQTGH